MGALPSRSLWGVCGGASTAEGGRRLGYCPHFTTDRQGPGANRPTHLESKGLDQVISRAFL